MCTFLADYSLMDFFCQNRENKLMFSPPRFSLLRNPKTNQSRHNKVVKSDLYGNIGEDSLLKLNNMKRDEPALQRVHAFNQYRINDILNVRHWSQSLQRLYPETENNEC